MRLYDFVANICNRLWGDDEEERSGFLMTSPHPSDLKTNDACSIDAGALSSVCCPIRNPKRLGFTTLLQ